jgi:Alpha/beta hydrolase family
VLASCLYAAIASWSAIVAGHPSYPIFYSLLVAVGLWVVIRSVRKPRPGRIWSSLLGFVGMAVLAGLAWWLAPFTADQIAIDALDQPGILTTQTPTYILLEPKASTSHKGLVFQPGARVDARAYAHILSGVVEAGHTVVIVKQPLGIGFLATGFAENWSKGHTDIAWASGGHSLGGVVASMAPEGVADVVLWASFPASDMSTSDIGFLSVFGTEDSFATPDDIEASRSNLPELTLFVPVEGGIHSYFGDYGLQPGDGVPRTDRATAQGIIILATNDFLSRPSASE